MRKNYGKYEKKKKNKNNKNSKDFLKYTSIRTHIIHNIFGKNLVVIHEKKNY